jgi:hypothetical protein
LAKISFQEISEKEVFAPVSKISGLRGTGFSALFMNSQLINS